MPCLVLSFQYIPKAAYYFSKNSGALCQDEPKKYKEYLARTNIYNKPHKILVFSGQEHKVLWLGTILFVEISSGFSLILMIHLI